mgnify:CR=1 FL=1
MSLVRPRSPTAGFSRYSPRAAELKAVDFGNNSMGKDGAAALADLLRGSKAITDVGMAWLGMGDTGRACTAVCAARRAL